MFGGFAKIGDTLLSFREAIDLVKLFLDLEIGLTDLLMTDAFSRDKYSMLRSCYN